MTAPFIPPAAADDARVALAPRTPGLLAALLSPNRIGAASPGNLPLDRGSVPVDAQDLSQIAGHIVHAFYVGSGMKAGADAGKALSSGRGFDRLGAKQPIAGPLLTAALAAAPALTEWGGPLVRRMAGMSALATDGAEAALPARLLGEDDFGISKVAKYATPGGHVTVSYTPNGNGTADIVNVQAEGGPNSIGPRSIAAIRDDLAQRTGASRLEGNRISGANPGRIAGIDTQ